MAEALGLAVNVIAVLQLAQEVAAATYRYAKAYKSAPADIQSLQRELTFLIGILNVIKDDCPEEGPDDWDASLNVVGGPLWLCIDVLKTIKDKMGGTAKVGNKISGMKRLLWPFKEGEVKEHLVRLDRAKAILELSLSADASTVTKEVQKLCQETKETTETTLQIVQKMQDEQLETKKEAILRQISDDEQTAINWLHGNLDYEINHREARKLHQPSTGNWFVEGGDDGDFAKWLSGNKRHLWLHGIPGAGKTVLMSTIIATSIENLQKRPNADKLATGYFYFSFRDEKKQKACNMLSCILVQLCSQISSGSEAISAVMELHERYKRRPGRPSCDELLEVIEYISKQALQQLYIFLDALDECGSAERAEVFESVRKLSELEGLSLIVTSRKEADIDDTLNKELAFEPISIQTEAVNHDIKVFVESILEKDPVLKRNNTRVKGRILEALVSGAQGMLTSSENAGRQSQILSSLSCLPKTLHGMYDRMIEAVPEDDRKYLRRALAWIIYAKHRLDVWELAEAMTVEPGSRALDEDCRFGDPIKTIPVEDANKFKGPRTYRSWRGEARLDDPEELEAVMSAVAGICGSLIMFTKNIIRAAPHVQISHYSVEEYLTSETVSRGPLRWIYMGKNEGNDVILETCLTYLQWDNFGYGEGHSYYWAKDLRTEFPLYDYVARYWGKHVLCHQESSIMRKANILLRPRPYSGNFLLWNKFLDWAYRSDVDRDATPLRVACKYGLTETVKQMIESGLYRVSEGCKYNNEQPIHIAASKGHLGIVRILLEDGGADIEAADTNGETPLAHALHWPWYVNWEPVATFLLEKGADKNRAMEGLFKSHKFGDDRGRIAAVFLVKAGADFMRKITYAFGTQNVLYIALEEGERWLPVLELLVEKGAHLKDPVFAPWEVYCAIIGWDNSKRDLFEPLIPCINKEDPVLGPILERAVLLGCEGIIEKVIEIKGPDVVNSRTVNDDIRVNIPLLEVAIYTHRWGTIKLLVKNGAWIDLTSSSCRDEFQFLKTRSETEMPLLSEIFDSGLKRLTLRQLEAVARAYASAWDDYKEAMRTDGESEEDQHEGEEWTDEESEGEEKDRDENKVEENEEEQNNGQGNRAEENRHEDRYGGADGYEGVDKYGTDRYGEGRCSEDRYNRGGRDDCDDMGSGYCTRSESVIMSKEMEEERMSSLRKLAWEAFRGWELHDLY